MFLTQMAMPLIEHVSDDADINAELRAHAQAGKMEVMRELGKMLTSLIIRRIG